jgi:dihydropteroate synthase
MSLVQLVGILNITPDSFSHDGVGNNVDKAMRQARQLFADGASMIDVGAEATNPQAAPITPDAEWERLAPVLSQLLPAYPGKVSVDTHHAVTVERVVQQLGTDFIVNDVTGMNDPAMRTIVAHYGLRCIVSHLPARFNTDIHAAHADARISEASDVLGELLVRRAQLIEAGLAADSIILDPGIGFGKTKELNRTLLQFAAQVHDAGFDNEVMIGYSRKRFLGENRFDVAPNLEAAKIAVAAGATYLRVHDVSAHQKLLASLHSAS